MSARVQAALVGAFIALPFQAVQLALAVGHERVAASFQALGVANLVLLIGVCALAADFPLAKRRGRAALVGIGIPMLLPGPTVLDGLVSAMNPTDALAWAPFLVLNLLLLMMLGCAEAGIYLMATRPRPTP